MCQTILEGGRRCPCDNSETRRLRKHNTAAKKKFANEIKSQSTKNPSKLSLKTFDKPVSSDHINEPTMAQVEDFVKNISALRSYMLNIESTYFFTDDQKRENVIPSVVFADGTTFETGYLAAPNHITNQKIQERLEEETIKLGETISNLVTYRTGFTDEFIKETNDKFKKEAKEESETFLADKEKWDNYHKTLWNDDETSSYKYASRMIREAASGNEKAKKWETEYADLNQKYKNVFNNLQVAEQGTDPGTQNMLTQNREEYLKILKEIRPLGGTINVTNNSQPKAAKIIKEIEQFYPKAWIDDSNAKDPFRAKYTKARAHYNDGALQKTYKLVPLRHITYEKEGWKPDLTNPNEYGIYHQIPVNGIWSAEDGYTYEAATVQGETAWVKESVEFYRTWSNESQPEHKPRGNGWKQIMVKNRIYDPNTHQTVTGELEKQWVRPRKSRKLVEAISQPEVTISGQGVRVGIHEFAHRVESTSATGKYITRLEETFLKRRTTINGQRDPLKTIYRGTKEKGREDNFIDVYMGKEYHDRYREILSTGAETLFAGSFGSFIGLGNRKSDPEMKAFIVGLWASA